MKKGSQENALVEYRFSHVWDDEVVPIERYFTAASSEEALEMFAYTCLKTGRKPILQEFATWDRWQQSWNVLPIPEREEYTVGEDALVQPPPEEEASEEHQENPEAALKG